MSRRVIVVGGGAAGFFAAIVCAEAARNTEVILIERGASFLQKVRISGGGRCNVTHACFDPRELAARYPRGGRALISPLQCFGPRETVSWFESRGVPLKTEKDGRIFPATNSSQTIMDCLFAAAKAAGVKRFLHRGVERVTRIPAGGFEVLLSGSGFPRPDSAGERILDEKPAASPLPSGKGEGDAGASLRCDRLLLATGGARMAVGAALAVALGHTLEPPVPSLFAFQVESPWLRGLAGVSVESAEISVPGEGLRERGPMLVTHAGLSGPSVLRLSAWGARKLHALDYRFPLRVNWLPELTAEAVASELRSGRDRHPGRLVSSAPLPPLPARLWEKLCLAAGIGADTRWAAFSAAAQRALTAQLTRGEVPVTGKSLNKEEFVTCGGVRLAEVDFRTMESRLCPGLHLAGELLDVDGITGGFNFQAAWTTGWIAGRAMAGTSTG